MATQLLKCNYTPNLVANELPLILVRPFNYNPFLVYCRELAPGTVSLTGDRAQGDDNKHDSHYTLKLCSVRLF